MKNHKKKLLLLLLNVFTLAAFAQDYSHIYAVGDAFDCGWVKENAYLMENEGNGVYTWSGNMKQKDFKFLLKTNKADEWINCLNAEAANELVVIGKVHKIRYVENSRLTNDDYKFMMSSTGWYKITIDTNHMTMVVSNDDLLSASALNGKCKRFLNVYACSGKATDKENAYKLLLRKDQIGNNTNNKWADNSAHPWVIFSLPAIYSINKFGFRDGRTVETGSDVYNIPEYKVYVSTTGTADEDWKEIIHETNVGDQSTKSKVIDPVEARYIKFVPIKNANDSYVRIYGVDIHGTYARSLNTAIVSTGKTIINYQDCYSDRETPANILDGNTENTDGVDANNPWAFVGKDAVNGWVTIDLEQECNIQKFVLTDSEDWITGYQVYASNYLGSDSDWKLIYDGTFENDRQVKKEGVLATPVTYRYLKLVIPAERQNTTTRIREFEVYGSPAEDPGIITDNAELKSAYDVALGTVKQNTTQAGILNAGAHYNEDWTRDISINVWNGFPLLEPDIARHSMLHMLENTNEQCIGNQYWDKMIWVKGAYMYYLMTGDKDILSQIFKSGVNTIHQLETMEQKNAPVFDTDYGLFTGPSVFNDGIAGYESPVWTSGNSSSAIVDYPASVKIKCLSTNCVYYEAYRLLAHLAKELNNAESETEMTKKADDLKASIRKNLFDTETGKFSYLIDQNGDLHHFQEGLGNAFAILFDIVTPAEAERIISQIQVTKHGLPSIYPHFERFNGEKPGRHNMMIWPFVNAFYAEACAKSGKYDQFTSEFFNLIDLGVNKGNHNFWEIYEPTNGTPDGGWQIGRHWDALDTQTWSATGFLSMVWNGLAGMNFEEGKVTFKPFLPTGVNRLELTNLRYGQMTLNIKLEGEGTKVKDFRVNGFPTENHEIPQTLTGTQNVSILLENENVGISPEKVASHFFTATPEKGSINVQLDNGYCADSISLFNLEGKILSSQKNAKGTCTVGNHLAQGIYTLVVKSAKGSYSQKMIVP